MQVIYLSHRKSRGFHVKRRQKKATDAKVSMVDHFNTALGKDLSVTKQFSRSFIGIWELCLSFCHQTHNLNQTHNVTFEWEHVIGPTKIEQCLSIAKICLSQFTLIDRLKTLRSKEVVYWFGKCI